MDKEPLYMFTERIYDLDRVINSSATGLARHPFTEQYVARYVGQREDVVLADSIKLYNDLETLTQKGLLTPRSALLMNQLPKGLSDVEPTDLGYVVRGPLPERVQKVVQAYQLNLIR